MRILVLYTELAAYILSSFKSFLDSNTGADMLIVHYPINAEAPFEFKSLNNANLTTYQADKTTVINDEINRFKPEIILCSGWGNTFYLKVVKQYHGSAKTVLCFDNRWNGSLKQRLLASTSKFNFLKTFKYCWVAGNPQADYAKKLGFKSENIFTGLYTADNDLFQFIGKEKLKLKGVYPKKIICVARYIPQKDLPTLWKAFINVNTKFDNRWHLDCFGNGILFENRIENVNIKHYGFVQPSDMSSYLLESGFFVLPSLSEPWGVVVQEMALSALPMILSNNIGAATEFLDATNGLSFEAGNQEDLEKQLSILMGKTDEQLWEMAQNSWENGLKHEKEDWVKTMLEIYNNNKNVWN